MSVKAVIKSLEQSVADNELHEGAINEYIEKFFPSEISQSERLNEELVKLYNANATDKPPAAVLILGIVRLHSVLLNPRILEIWFGCLAPYALDSSGVKNDLVEACREFIRVTLDSEDSRESAKKYVEWMLEIYFKKDMGGWITVPNITMERRRFIRYNCRELILFIFPRSVETCSGLINVYVTEKEHRLLALQLLSTCVSKCDQSKLFKIVDFELFQSLFKCLEYDQSSTSLGIAESTLAMILPHVCDKLAPFLPRLYACFGRMCSWFPEHEYERDADAEPSPDVVDGWEVLKCNEEDQTPSCESLFMILYGLFPNNTLAFCREPKGYLQKHEYKRPFDDFWNKRSIQNTSDGLFAIFLLHPGLIHSSEELEISTNTTRWQSYRSTVDVITQCVDLHVAQTDNYAAEDDDKHLTSLLSEHNRLFRSNMARFTGTMSPGATGSIRSARSRSASRTVSRTASPSGLRQQLPFGASLGPHEKDNLTALTTTATVPVTAGSSSSSSPRPEQEARRRSKSQPPQPSELQGLLSLTPAMPSTTANSPMLAPIAAGSSTGGSIGTHPEAASEYFFRELLLSKNELDFSNFNNYILERRLVQLQKKLAKLEMANVRVDNLVQKNKQLTTRLNVLEKDNVKAQKSARTLLTQRTSYESRILDKNKELKQQLVSLQTESKENEEEIGRLRYQYNELQTLTDVRGNTVAELELTVTRLRAKLDQALRDNQQLQRPVSRFEQLANNDSLDEGADELANNISTAILETKIQQLDLESQGLNHDYETRISAMENENHRLKAVIRELELKIDSTTMLTQRYDSTRRKVHEIQAQASRQYSKLKAAHEELLGKYSETERELRARRVHDEERMNELRSTLATTQPFQSDSESRYEMKVRGGRGGAQKR